MTQINRHDFFMAIDIKRMRAIFAEHLPLHLDLQARVIDLTIPRVVPRGQGGFAIQYNVKIDSANTMRHELTLYGRLLGPNEKYPPCLNNGMSSIVIDELRMAIPIFPFDPDFSHLPDLVSESFVIPLLRKCLAAEKSASLSLENIKILGYRLGRRCVIEYDVIVDDDRRMKFVAKLVKDALKHNSWRNLQLLESKGFDADAADLLTVPHLYYMDQATGAYFMEYADGVSLHDLLGSADFIAGAAAAGKILRKLHGSAIEVSGSYSCSDEMRNLAKFMVAGEIFPEWNDRLARACERLESDASSMSANFDTVLAHRDFYDKQVLYSQGRVTLLDCESLTIADPALDFANFLAHLKLRALQEPAHASMLRMAAEAFAQCYGVRHLNFDDRTRWWMASSLTRLACLYALRPRWSKLAPFLINNALDILDGKNIIIGGANSD